MPLPLALASSIALFALAPGGAEPSARLEAEIPSGPERIVGGTEATTCQWPAVVSILEDDETPVMCTGSLVHPQVVMTAAHCIVPERPIVAVGFGEHGQTSGVPVRVVAVTQCVGNPPYYTDVGADVGYCLLAEPVEGLPIVPLLAGCEAEAVATGTEVVIVGFGATWGNYDVDGELQTMGVGTKRWTTQTVDFIDAFFQEINLYDDSGSQSACFGDSGGPALVQLPDGTWRVLGAGSHVYDPGGLPPPLEPDNFCGTGAAYAFVPFALPWLESATGIDLSPCWDGDVWVAEPGCGSFPSEPHAGIGAWAMGCVGGALGGGEAPACAELPPPGTSGTDGTDGTDDGTTWVDDTGVSFIDATTGPGPGPATSGTDPLPPGPAPGDAGSGDSDGSGNAGIDDDALAERGCACTAGPDRPFVLTWLMVLAGLGHRRAGRRARRARRSRV